jgi:hypothetical protein
MRFRTLEDLQRLVDDEDSTDDDSSTGEQTMTTLKFTAANERERGRDAAEIVVMRARKLCFERHQDPNKFEFINAATIEVLESDPALGQAYKELREACQ